MYECYNKNDEYIETFVVDYLDDDFQNTVTNIKRRQGLENSGAKVKYIDYDTKRECIRVHVIL